MSLVAGGGVVVASREVWLSRMGNCGFFLAVSGNIPRSDRDPCQGPGQWDPLSHPAVHGDAIEIAAPRGELVETRDRVTGSMITSPRQNIQSEWYISACNFSS